MATRMTAEAAAKVRKRFRTSSQSLDGASTDLNGLTNDLTSGAGEFSHEISNATNDFQSSWRAVFEVFSDSSAVIAGNTNALYIDLMDLDDGSS